MQALTLNEGSLDLTAVPRPELGYHEALIRITRAGICSTDLEIVKGYAGGFSGIMGHEFVGVVESSPADRNWEGRRVCGTINVACQTCSVCTTTGPEHCPDRTVMGIINRDGCFAEYLALPLANLIEVPDTVSDDEAVFTEPLAAACRIVEQVDISPGQPISVVGPGRLGMLIGKVLQLAGGEVTMWGRRTASLALPTKWGLKSGLIEEAADLSTDVVVESTGNIAGLTHALRLVRPLGTLVLKSTFADRSEVDLTKIVVDELTVIGSRCGPFEAAMTLLAEHQVPVTDLVDGRYHFSEAIDAFHHAAQPGIRKILLDF